MRILVFPLVLLFVAFTAPATAGTLCNTFRLAGTFDTYFEVPLGGSLSLVLEQDALGAETSSIVDLTFCSITGVATSCQPFSFDTTGDGVADTSALGGAAASIEKLGVRGITSVNFIRAVETSTSGTDAPDLTVCFSSSD